MKRTALRSRRKPAEASPERQLKLADPAADISSVVNACIDCGAVITWKATRCRPCSAACNSRQRTPTEYDHICVTCGARFKSPKPVRKFCSQACMGQATRKPRVCVVCGEEFWARWYYTKTCSRRCLSKRRAETNRTYRNVPHPTGNVRETWYASKGSSCEVCGGVEALHLHHVVRVQDLDREHDPNDPANSMTLCQGCHFGHHRPGVSDTRIPLSLVPLTAVSWCYRQFGEAKGRDYLQRHYRSVA